MLCAAGDSFLPVKSILRTLDAMSYSKLSTLHWHIVDRESFPLVLESVPELSKGAWSKQEKYSAGDVRQIVEAARMRGEERPCFSLSVLIQNTMTYQDRLGTNTVRTTLKRERVAFHTTDRDPCRPRD